MSVTSQPAGPVTATGTASRNIDGQAIAITFFSTVKWWGTPVLRFAFAYIRRFPGATGTLERLAFIHFARWTPIRRLPANGPGHPKRKLTYPHLFFESNFNGGWEEYIDAFSHILTGGMKLFWGSSYGFPQPLPTGRFKAWIKRNQIEASHFYSAYPDATTTMVRAALELEGKVGALKERTAGADADAFATAWRAFLVDAQRCV